MIYTRYLPDYISGDFDSVDPDILNFYKGKVGCESAVNLSCALYKLGEFYPGLWPWADKIKCKIC